MLPVRLESHKTVTFAQPLINREIKVSFGKGLLIDASFVFLADSIANCVLLNTSTQPPIGHYFISRLQNLLQWRELGTQRWRATYIPV